MAETFSISAKLSKMEYSSTGISQKVKFLHEKRTCETKEEAVGAFLTDLRDGHPRYSVDQWIVSSPPCLAGEGSDDQEEAHEADHGEPERTWVLYSTKAKAFISPKKSERTRSLNMTTAPSEAMRMTAGEAEEICVNYSTFAGEPLDATLLLAPEFNERVNDTTKQQTRGQ